MVLGTAGTSDLEAELHKTLISDKQFYTQIGISLLTITAGTFGFIWYKNKIKKRRKAVGKHIRQQIRIRQQLGIPLTPEQVNHIKSLHTEVQVDNYLIMLRRQQWPA